MTIKGSVKSRKLEYLRQDLEYLRRIQKLDKEKFLKNFESRLATRHAAQEIGQIAIDIAFHLCAQNNLHEPRTYRDSFQILIDNDLLPQELGENLAKWAGLRNLLTHFYTEVDDARLYDILQKDLTTIDQFIAHLETFNVEE